MEFGDYLGNAYGWPWLCIWDIEPQYVWRGIALVGDVSIAGLVLGPTTVASEWLIRRREAHKT
jgi:hypothetical protein